MKAPVATAGSSPTGRSPCVGKTRTDEAILEPAPKPKANVPLAASGALGILLGVSLVGYGLAPAGAFASIMKVAFGGGTPPDDLGAQIDGAIAGLKGRMVWDVVGFVLLIAGIVCLKLAFRKPKPKTVEEQVEEAVRRRLAELGARDGVATGGLAASVLAASVPDEPIAVASPRPTVPASSQSPTGVWVDRPPVAASALLLTNAGQPGRCPRCGRMLLGGRFCRVCDR